jgi:hypothetical protein
MNKWEGIFQNQRRFLFITYQITKTSLSFSKSVMVREILDTQMVLRNVQNCFTNRDTKCEELFYSGTMKSRGALQNLRVLRKSSQRTCGNHSREHR